MNGLRGVGNVSTSPGRNPTAFRSLEILYAPPALLHHHRQRPVTRCRRTPLHATYAGSRQSVSLRVRRADCGGMDRVGRSVVWGTGPMRGPQGAVANAALTFALVVKQGAE